MNNIQKRTYQRRNITQKAKGLRYRMFLYDESHFDKEEKFDQHIGQKPAQVSSFYDACPVEGNVEFIDKCACIGNLTCSKKAKI